MPPIPPIPPPIPPPMPPPSAGLSCSKHQARALTHTLQHTHVAGRPSSHDFLLINVKPRCTYLLDLRLCDLISTTGL